ncbi:MAG: SDR family NAD(P)-dependent oxidoreductase [Dehalococcoidia bacterium]|nr:SDR family NAD(P)-dependent oxidoreductase [Dehalococcoidia bacterium]
MNGKVVALVGRGTDLDRAIAVQCAEAGASVALATVADVQEQEFAVNSIANEVWSIGGAHFVRLMYAWEADQATSFADECWDRLQRCDALVINSSAWSRAPLEELSADEWDNTVRATLTTPFIVAQAFGRLMVREGAGRIVVVSPERPNGDLSEAAALAGLRATIAGMQREWGPEGVGFHLLDGPDADEAGAASRVFELLQG